jgi:hypothetical protein
VAVLEDLQEQEEEEEVNRQQGAWKQRAT